MTANIIAWDIGGAHLKAAIVDRNGQIIDVVQRQCSLWKDRSKLEQTIADLIVKFDSQNDRHAITMTGELADCFNNRDEGVETILKTVSNQISEENTFVFAGRKGFIQSGDVSRHDYPSIASGNWLATGLWAAGKVESALLIDIGSTTTDITTIEQGQVVSKGYTDFERILHGELVYTGVVRTPVMAVAKQIYFEGNAISIIAEVFATTADVYRLTGELSEYTDQMPAADNGPKTLNESARRLARMIGRDVESAAFENWKNMAVQLRNQQLASIQSACDKQLSLSAFNPKTFIGAGIGRFIVKALAARCGYPYTDFSALLPNGSTKNQFHLADCAPVVCVARLLRQNLYP